MGAFPIRFQTELDLVSVAFAVALALVCGIVFGLAPSLHLAGVGPQAAIRSGARGASRSPLRDALMAIEVGVALVVLLAAAMVLRSFGDARDVDPGIPPRRRAAGRLRPDRPEREHGGRA